MYPKFRLYTKTPEKTKTFRISQNSKEKDGIQNLVRTSIDANINKTLIIFSKCIILSTSNSYFALIHVHNLRIFLCNSCYTCRIQCQHLTPPNVFVFVLCLHMCKVFVIEILNKIHQVVGAHGFPHSTC